MIRSKLTGPSQWEQYDPNGHLPPPIIIKPKGIPAIPESLYFRLIVHFLRQYSEMGEPQLSRNCCTFYLGNRMMVELLYHSRGQCMIATVSGDFKEASSQRVSKLCRTRTFLVDSMEKAKEMGMKGLKYGVFCLLAKCLKDETSGGLLVDEKSLVCLDGYRPNEDHDLLTRSGDFLSETDLRRVSIWFGTQKPFSSEAETLVANRARALAEKVNSHLFPAYFENSTFPEKVLHIVCKTPILPALLRSGLGVSASDLCQRPNPATDYEKRRDILEVWIQKTGRTATLEHLFDVIKESNHLGSVSESVTKLVN
eukprot:m.269394 g.269394  ORF g.269394 m.269394 type:complete len:311 (+) comp40535_c0_seq12:2396-3328(+)